MQFGKAIAVLYQPRSAKAKTVPILFPFMPQMETVSPIVFYG
jgi:hypothetical protein